MGNRKKTLLWILAGMVAVGVLAACGKNMEKAWFNVWFYPPNGDKVLLGKVEGITQCRALAKAKGQYLAVGKQKGDYACCLRTETSECEQSLK